MLDVFFDFFLRRKANRQDFSARAGDGDCFQNSFGIYFLVKRYKNQRVAPRDLICRNHLLDFRRRRGERPDHIFRQSLTVRRFCSGGNASRKFRRHRETLCRVEHQSFRSEPTPFAFDAAASIATGTICAACSCEVTATIGCENVTIKSGRELNFAFGRKAHDFERSSTNSDSAHSAARRRKFNRNHLPGFRRRQSSDSFGEIGFVVGLFLNRRNAFQQIRRFLSESGSVFAGGLFFARFRAFCHLRLGETVNPLGDSDSYLSVSHFRAYSLSICFKQQSVADWRNQTEINGENQVRRNKSFHNFYGAVQRSNRQSA